MARLLDAEWVPGPVRVCRQGHPLDGWRRRGPGVGRYCRICNVATNRRWRQRHRIDDPGGGTLHGPARGPRR